MQGRPGAFRLLLTGGGTGGHIYPALSIAAACREKVSGVDILYVGTADGLEARLVPRAGITFAAVAAGGLVGKDPLGAARGAGSLARGLWQALALVRRFQPHVVVGTGGYASVPVVAAAVLLGVPVALQEQNAVPGVANRVLSRFAGFVAAAYEESRLHFPRGARVRVTGNPVRPEVLRGDREEARRSLGVPAGARQVLVFMGSRGSATVSRAIADMLPHFAGQPEVRLMIGTGEAHYDAVLRRLAELGLPAQPEPAAGGAGAAPGGEARVALVGGNVKVCSYIFDMTTALAAADLVVARAGAITLAEMTARGLPGVLVPSPHVTHHHQELNARVLEGRGAARVLAEEGLTGEALAQTVRGIIDDPAAMARMAGASRALGRPHALDDIVEGILALGAAGDRHRRRR